MKFQNWLGMEGDASLLNVNPNKSIAGTPLISMSVIAGSVQFVHTVTPTQARALAEHLLELAEQAEEVTEVSKPWYMQGVTV